jgi:hypothetical protein
VAATRSELISPRIRTAVREAVGGYSIYTLRLISNLFESEGFRPAPDKSADELPESRRELCDRSHAAIDWTSTSEARQYLYVVERVIDDYDAEIKADSAGSSDYAKRVARIRAALARSGIGTDESGRLRLPRGRAVAGMRLAGVPSESDIRLHAGRLARLDQEPEEMIGAAKELVEATAKHVMIDLGHSPSGTADVAALSKQALNALNLHPDAIAPTGKVAATMKRMLAGLQQIAIGIAELRNEGYGTGHGRGSRIPGVKQRHADFVARAAVAYSEMMLDTLQDPDAPWRPDAAGS